MPFGSPHFSQTPCMLFAILQIPANAMHAVCDSTSSRKRHACCLRVSKFSQTPCMLFVILHQFHKRHACCLRVCHFQSRALQHPGFAQSPAPQKATVAFMACQHSHVLCLTCLNIGTGSALKNIDISAATQHLQKQSTRIQRNGCGSLSHDI